MLFEVHVCWLSNQKIQGGEQNGRSSTELVPWRTPSFSQPGTESAESTTVPCAIQSISRSSEPTTYRYDASVPLCPATPIDYFDQCSHTSTPISYPSQHLQPPATILPQSQDPQTPFLWKSQDRINRESMIATAWNILNNNYSPKKLMSLDVVPPSTVPDQNVAHGDASSFTVSPEMPRPPSFNVAFSDEEGLLMESPAEEGEVLAPPGEEIPVRSASSVSSVSSFGVYPIQVIGTQTPRRSCLKGTGEHQHEVKRTRFKFDLNKYRLGYQWITLSRMFLSSYVAFLIPLPRFSFPHQFGYWTERIRK